MKILIGVMLALTVALGFTGWQLRTAWRADGERQQVLERVQGALAVANARNVELQAHMDQFNQALKRLDDQQRQNQTNLEGRLAGLRNLVKQPGDTDESILCRDVRLPAQLDNGL